jgi:hypothetical protein
MELNSQVLASQGDKTVVQGIEMFPHLLPVECRGRDRREQIWLAFNDFVQEPMCLLMSDFFKLLLRNVFHEGSSVKLNGMQVGSLRRHSNGMDPRHFKRGGQ